MKCNRQGTETKGRSKGKEMKRESGVGNRGMKRMRAEQEIIKKK